MMIIETIGGVLLATCALGFLLLGAFDRPLGDRRRTSMSTDIEPGSDLAATARLLRVSHATLKVAFGDHDLEEAGRDSRNFEKVA